MWKHCAPVWDFCLCSKCRMATKSIENVVLGSAISGLAAVFYMKTLLKQSEKRDLAGRTETSPWLHPHHVTLESVLSQVKAAADRVDVTMPSDRQSAGIFIAVGTSHGLNLLTILMDSMSLEQDTAMANLEKRLHDPLRLGVLSETGLHQIM